MTPQMKRLGISYSEGPLFWGSKIRKVFFCSRGYREISTNPNLTCNHMDPLWCTWP